jgi:imidazole glycerol phosphate synthase subunit HisF
VSIEDKELIEQRFGPLWSGKTEISFQGGVRTFRDVKRALDLAGEDVMSIDLHALPDGTFAFRYYDGDDRRIVVLVIDAEGEILEEFRAHIAEWLGELYYETGALAYDADAMLHLLRKKTEEGGASSFDPDRC